MKCSINTAKLLTAFMLAMICGSASAEYKAITKLSRCEFTAGSAKPCKNETDPSELELTTLTPGLDETDIKACEAITDNINSMENTHYDWNYGFAISAHNFLLSIPPWVEVTGKDKCDVLAAASEGYKNFFRDDPEACAHLEYAPIYGFNYNVDSSVGDEKIYASHVDDKIKPGPYRKTFWTAEKDGTSLEKRLGKGSTIRQSDADPVMFASRLYFVEYNRGVPRFDQDIKGGFVVHVLTMLNNAGIKYYLPACIINPIKPSASTKE